MAKPPETAAPDDLQARLAAGLAALFEELAAARASAHESAREAVFMGRRAARLRSVLRGVASDPGFRHLSEWHQRLIREESS